MEQKGLVHIEVYQDEFDYICNHLDTCKFNAYLYATGFITLDHHQKVDQEYRLNGREAASKTFLSEVLMKDLDEEHFSTFIDILNERNQKHVAEHLRNAFSKKKSARERVAETVGSGQNSAEKGSVSTKGDPLGKSPAFTDTMVGRESVAEKKTVSAMGDPLEKSSAFTDAMVGRESGAVKKTVSAMGKEKTSHPPFPKQTLAVIDALTEESHADIHSIVCVLHRKRIFHHKDYKKMMKILKSDRKYRCAKSVFSKILRLDHRRFDEALYLLQRFSRNDVISVLHREYDRIHNLEKEPGQTDEQMSLSRVQMTTVKGNREIDLAELFEHQKISETDVNAENPYSQEKMESTNEKEPIGKAKDAMQFEISSSGASYYFPENDITVEIPPNVLPPSKSPLIASISKEYPQDSEHALSEIYEFSPSGLGMQNQIMFVIPLFHAHNYDYDNMRLMYLEDSHGEFVLADTIKANKPAWIFHGNLCYIFLSHFCKAYVVKKPNSYGKIEKSIHLATLLFFKYSESADSNSILELKTTFGCFARKSKCSKFKVIEHYKNAGYNIGDEMPAYVFETGQLSVQLDHCRQEWKSYSPVDAPLKIKGIELMDMCRFCKSANEWPICFSHELLQVRELAKETQHITVCITHDDQSIQLQCKVSQLPSATNWSWRIAPITLQDFDRKHEIRDIFHNTISPEIATKTASVMGIKHQTSSLTPKQFTDVFLSDFLRSYHGAQDFESMLKSLIEHLTKFSDLGETAKQLRDMPLNRQISRDVQQRNRCIHSDCRLKIAKETLGEQNIIFVLCDVKRSFCPLLSVDVFSQTMSQNIMGASNDSEALFYIRQAIDACMKPDFLDIILKVLRSETIGKGIHADKIEDRYKQLIEDHRDCAKCARLQ